MLEALNVVTIFVHVSEYVLLGCVFPIFAWSKSCSSWGWNKTSWLLFDIIAFHFMADFRAVFFNISQFDISVKKHKSPKQKSFEGNQPCLQVLKMILPSLCLKEVLNLTWLSSKRCSDLTTTNLHRTQRGRWRTRPEDLKQIGSQIQIYNLHFVLMIIFEISKLVDDSASAFYVDDWWKETYPKHFPPPPWRH